MVLEEAEPIGGFTGISISEPLLQGGILLSVVGYMLALSPGLLPLDWRSFCPDDFRAPAPERHQQSGRGRILVKRGLSGVVPTVHRR